jgi:hypothetical protein
MPALTKSTSIKPTGHDVGLELTVVLKAYDNGKIYIDGQPMIDPESTNAGYAWAIANFAEKVALLQRAMEARHRHRSTTTDELDADNSFVQDE